MASNYKIIRSNENKLFYFLTSVFVLYQYSNLLNDFDMNKTTDLLLLIVSSVVLFFFFVIVYMNRIFFFDTYLVLICAPKLILVKYDKIKILGFKNIQSKKDNRFMKDEYQIHLEVKNKAFSFSTSNNKEVIKLLQKRQNQSSKSGDGTMSDKK